MNSTLLGRARTTAHALRTTFAPLAPLVARLTVGIVFIGSGWGKLHNLEKVTAYFTELGIPAAGLQAPFVSSVELVGGILVLLGFGSRIASLLLASTMVVALVTAKRAEIHGFSDLFGTVEWTYLALLGWIAIAGPGALSVDGLRQRFAKTTAPKLAPVVA